MAHGYPLHEFVTAHKPGRTSMAAWRTHALSLSIARAVRVRPGNCRFARSATDWRIGMDLAVHEFCRRLKDTGIDLIAGAGGGTCPTRHPYGPRLLTPLATAIR
jgi:hypothetical protein